MGGESSYSLLYSVDILFRMLGLFYTLAIWTVGGVECTEWSGHDQVDDQAHPTQRRYAEVSTCPNDWE
jgi:hypothetical protein